ncbi:OmpP1/FadL family transporter [Candidatus Neomarinimicrobiota bacterium]
MLTRATYHRQSFAYMATFLLMVTGQLVGQHRGDYLAYQGMAHLERSGAKAQAMGGAITAIPGDLNAIFWNPAGLSSIDRPRLAVSMSSNSKLWQENQVYRPNRLYVTLPFYLEGLYVPDPANNGRLDHELAQDTNYVVAYPELGLEPFSEAAADWQNEIVEKGFNQVAVAAPMRLFGKSVVLGLAYHMQSGMLDYDRNDTYLAPHLGSTEYEILWRVETDTANVDWNRFLRKRSGETRKIHGAAAITLSERIQLGIRLNLFTGETDDVQSLNKIGYFHLYDDNRFSFSYDTLKTETAGYSTFSALDLTLGGLLKLTNFNVGISITLPYTMNREWEYETVISDTGQSLTTPESGKDQLKLPASYTLGLSFTPTEAFTLAFDIEKLPYSEATFDLANGDTTHKPWVDSSVLRLGVEFRPTDFLSLRGGYQYIGQEFVPDGAAFKTQGPAANRYTLGTSLRLGGLGRVDIAYHWQQLKYYDSYYSNTNYVLELFNRMTVEYVYSF